MIKNQDLHYILKDGYWKTLNFNLLCKLNSYYIYIISNSIEKKKSL